MNPGRLNLFARYMLSIFILAPGLCASGGEGGRMGALVDEVVFVQESDLGKAVELIERGTHHLYAAGITSSALYRRIKRSPAIEYDYSYGMSIELSLNPSGPLLADGTLNPFNSSRVRESLNWLIDRQYVSDEIFGGLAVPRFLPINTAFPDYSRLAKTARALEMRYSFNPRKGRESLARGMEELGAEISGGRWHHEGRQIRLKVLIRTEDERRRLGDYAAGILEELGFAVERIYRTAEEASRLWIAEDPSAGRWHVYTGGWVSIIIQRDLAGNFDFYYTPRGRPEPLWQAYEPSDRFDEISNRLQRRDYRGREERDTLMSEALALAMQDSARVWVADALNIWPRQSGISLAVDLAGGVSGSALWPYTLRFSGREGGRVVCGIPNLLTEPWNPVDGTSWIFDLAIIRALGDPDFIPDPFTGLYWPQRVKSAAITVREDSVPELTHDWLELETAAEIKVPEDVWIDWHQEEGRFITAGESYPEGISARARTLIRYEPGYFERAWHDGSRISPADIIVGWLLSFERSKEGSPFFDMAHSVGFEAFRKHYRGWRILRLDPLEIEVFSDQVLHDAEWTAAARAPSVSPWHVLAVAMLAEKNSELAFSSSKADRLKIDWMNFVAGPSLHVLKRHLQTAGAEKYIPFRSVLEEYLEPGEAETRYEALNRWVSLRNHFWVGNGPFYLHSVHPVERIVVLRRFEDFPDASDRWLELSRPMIPVAELDGPMVLAGGSEVVFTLRVYAEGAPYPDSDIETVGYMVFDSSGNPAAAGSAEPSPDAAGAWSITLSADETLALGAGANTLEATVSSLRVALPSFATHVFATVPGENR